VTGGAWAARAGVPILITPSDSLHPAVAQALQAFAPSRTVLLGGTAALSAGVEQSVPRPRRVAGATRGDTAARIAAELWGGSPSRFVVIPGYHVDGWAYGLAAAGLAADNNAPVLIADGSGAPPQTLDTIRPPTCTQATDLTLVGGPDVIGATAERLLGETARAAC
jgi:putative cell wall-binding protein